MTSRFLLVGLLLATFTLVALASDPGSLQDFCVADNSSKVGFVTSNTDNKLFTQRLEKGDVFVFPQGLIHFQQNVGKGYALAIAALSSQNPGVITIADAVFGSNPDISDDILARAFQVDKKVIDEIQSNF
ncbi:germin, RmlC-like cupin domain protein [Tanacetum coccineum]